MSLTDDARYTLVCAAGARVHAAWAVRETRSPMGTDAARPASSRSPSWFWVVWEAHPVKLAVHVRSKRLLAGCSGRYVLSKPPPSDSQGVSMTRPT